MHRIKPRTLLVPLVFTLALFAVVPGAAQAQHTVTGTVTDSTDGTSLPGVNVLVEGATMGTTTDADGEYTLEAPSPTDTLIFSFIGYETQEVPIESRSEINVLLPPAVAALEEIVVSVGYQEQTVATTTGSVSQISGEDLDNIPVTNLTNALKGTVPGLIGVTETGRPGFSNANLLVRGAATLNNNAPLVVIDGVPGRGGLGQLNPSDIESISVLKGAMAAIYGSRAANGVILVQTKRGIPGETRINVNVEQSYSRPARVPDMADAATYMTMLNEVDMYRGNAPRYSQEQVENHRNPPEGSWEYFDTDWYDAALKDYSRETTANASVSGGSETFQYRISLEGETQEGILVNSGSSYDQIGFRTALDGDLTENLNLTLNLHGRLEDRRTPAFTRGLNSAWEMLQRGKPNEPAFWPNGRPGPAQEQGVNPVVSNQTGYQDREIYRFQSSLSLEVDIPAVEGWSLEGTVAYDQFFMNEKRWQEPWTLYSASSETENEHPVLLPISSGVPEPRLEQWDNSARDILLRATSTYETSLGNHNVNLLLGTEWQSQESNSLYAYRRFFPTNQIQLLFAGGQAEQNLDGGGSHAARLNFFGRTSYDYKEKYLLQIVARYDGSYIFPEGERFGFFPAIAAGWRLAEEPWFNDMTSDFFDELKLRASYGQTGNDRIEPYQFLGTYGFNGEFAYADGLGVRIAPTRVPNESITWEVATMLDVGLQGAILDNRVAFDFTYFHQLRDDILWFRSEAIPQTAGFRLPRENIAQVTSQGVEGLVSYRQPIASNIVLRAAANFTYAKNKIKYIAEPVGVVPWQQQTGNPMFTSLYYIADGIWNTQEEIDNAEAVWPDARPGDIRFKDINEDGQITGDDRRRIDENGRPDLIGALSLGATVGQFDVQLLFQGAALVRQYVFTGAAGEFGNYFQEFAENRWTPENTDASGPRAYNRVDPYWASNSSTYFLQDARYLRLKSFRLGYSLPDDWLRQFGGMERFMVYLSGRNLFTWTPLTIGDPEIRQSATHVYPPEKAFTVGFWMTF